MKPNDQAIAFFLALSLMGAFGTRAIEFEDLQEALYEASESKDRQEVRRELQAGESGLDRGEQRAPGPDDGAQALAQRHQEELEDTQTQIAELREAYALKHFGLDRAEREDAMERFDDQAQQTLTMLTERQLDELREVERSRDEVAREAPLQQDRD